MTVQTGAATLFTQYAAPITPDVTGRRLGRHAEPSIWFDDDGVAWLITRNAMAGYEETYSLFRAPDAGVQDWEQVAARVNVFGSGGALLSIVRHPTNGYLYGFAALNGGDTVSAFRSTLASPTTWIALGVVASGLEPIHLYNTAPMMDPGDAGRIWLWIDTDDGPFESSGPIVTSFVLASDGLTMVEDGATRTSTPPAAMSMLAHFSPHYIAERNTVLFLCAHFRNVPGETDNSQYTLLDIEGASLDWSLGPTDPDAYRKLTAFHMDGVADAPYGGNDAYSDVHFYVPPPGKDHACGIIHYSSAGGPFIPGTGDTNDDWLRQWTSQSTPEEVLLAADPGHEYPPFVRLLAPSADLSAHTLSPGLKRSTWTPVDKRIAPGFVKALPTMVWHPGVEAFVAADFSIHT